MSKAIEGLSVVDFFESEAILNVKTLSPTQKIILKVINGELLDNTTPIPKQHKYQDRDFTSEVDLFLFLSGKDEYIPGHKFLDISLAAGRRSGKCHDINDLYTRADGSVHKFGDDIGKKIDVVSWNEKSSAYEIKKAKIFDNGTEECFEITTKYGQKLVRTGNHPLLATSGWVNIDNASAEDVTISGELKIGTRVAVPINNPNEGSEEQDLGLIKALAYFLADGSWTRTNFQYTFHNVKQMEELQGLIEFEDLRSDPRSEGTYRAYLKHSDCNFCRIVKSQNLWGTDSKTKFIPNIVYKLPNYQLKVFLNRLIATDGWACISKGSKCKDGTYKMRAEVGFSVVSEEMARSVKQLLARFGVVTNFFKAKAGYKKDGEYTKCSDRYSVIIENNSMIVKFFNEIGLLYGKEEMCQEVLKVAGDQADAFNSQLNTMPKEFCKGFALKLRQHIGSQTQERKYYGRVRPDRAVDKQTLIKYCLLLPEIFAEELKILEQDFYWDEVVSIKSIGDRPTAGMEVEDNHTYVGDLIEHNSCVIAAGYIIYLATQRDLSQYLGTSPHATMPIISPTREQAGEVYSAIKNFFLRSPYLFSVFLDGKIDGFKDEYDENDSEKKAFIGGVIKLNNKVVIKTMSADVSRIRGFACNAFCLDEACWFGVEGSDTKNTDQGIFEAIQPATAQFGEHSFGFKISSPNGQTGLMYNDYENRKDPDILHMKVPTWYMNPNISAKYLEKQRKKGEHYFNREYGAEYVASENSYLDPKLVDEAIMSGIEDVDYVGEYRYVAAMDYATKNDYWTFGIAHKEYHTHEVKDGDKTVTEKYGMVYVDKLRHWKGNQGKELDPKEVIQEISQYLKQYKVGYIVADQYAFAAVRTLFQQEGCNVKEFKMSMQSKKKVMYSLQVATNSQRFKMVDKPKAIRHLKDLREKRTASGTVKIEAAAGAHDDYADTIGLLLHQFDQNSSIYIGMTKDDDNVITTTTKDLRGKFIATPTAADIAEISGNHKFHDSRLDEKEEPEDEDGNFWFVF